MQWFAQAPSNIALIKYMGKQEGATNLPDNPSLSYTLNDLKSSVRLETLPGKHNVWEPLNAPGIAPFILSEKGQARYLAHLDVLKQHFHYDGGFLVQSSNNFPQSTGLASSASSFAALTKCAVLALSELTGRELPSLECQAQLSRMGSGSSCRSFFSPWALWDGEDVTAVDLPYPTLEHQVILISHEEKQVLSSEAHRRVKTSPFYATRAMRAKAHLKSLMDAFAAKDWNSAFEVCWQEFEDMHHLFETCEKPFTYQTAATRTVLQQLQAFWREQGDGPLVTMDAGPNVHLLYRPDQAALKRAFFNTYLLGNVDVL